MDYLFLINLLEIITLLTFLTLLHSWGLKFCLWNFSFNYHFELTTLLRDDNITNITNITTFLGSEFFSRKLSFNYYFALTTLLTLLTLLHSRAVYFFLREGVYGLFLNQSFRDDNITNITNITTFLGSEIFSRKLFF